MKKKLTTEVRDLILSYIKPLTLEDLTASELKDVIYEAELELAHKKGERLDEFIMDGILGTTYLLPRQVEAEQE